MDKLMYFYLFLWLISLRSKLSVLMEVWKNHGAPSPKATVNDFVELLIWCFWSFFMFWLVTLLFSENSLFWSRVWWYILDIIFKAFCGSARVRWLENLRCSNRIHFSRIIFLFDAKKHSISTMIAASRHYIFHYGWVIFCAHIVIPKKLHVYWMYVYMIAT